MATLNPFDLSADEIPQKYLYYWLVTWCRLIYEAETWGDWSDSMDTINDLVGADPGDMEIFPQEDWTLGDVRPRVEIIHAPDGLMVQTRGTINTPQLLLQAIQSQLSTRYPWPGQVMYYDSVAAQEIWEVISGSLDGETWISTGHSLGGALASLNAINDASFVWTIGEPRQGSVAYANGMSPIPKVRVVNPEDVVPKTPLAFNPTQIDPYSLGGWIFDLPFTPSSYLPSFVYRHWGTPVYYQRYGGWDVGTGDMSTYADLTPEMVAYIQTGDYTLTHTTGEYARRIRSTINARFPLLAPDDRWPGVSELDSINLALNLLPGRAPYPWRVDSRAGELIAGTLFEFVPLFVGGLFLRPPTNNPDVIPFECPGE